MTPFRTLEAIAAPLPLSNVDTDKILAARYLKTISREGLGAALFSSLRADPDFVLNRQPWDRAGILVALDNFGCGSSREHAPWALLDFGIRCVIAPSIADIFYNNCFKNGILPIVLGDDDVAALMELAADPASARMSIDLPAQTVAAGARTWHFAVDPKRKADLIDGVDDIARSLGHAQAIASWEEKHARAAPWFGGIDADKLAQVARSA